LTPEERKLLQTELNETREQIAGHLAALGRIDRDGAAMLATAAPHMASWPADDPRLLELRAEIDAIGRRREYRYGRLKPLNRRRNQLIAQLGTLLASSAA